MFAISSWLLFAKGAAADDGVINDASFCSTALFIALLTFAGIIVVEGSGAGGFRPEDPLDGNPLDFTIDVILFFAAENAFPARSPTALIPLSRITLMAIINNCLANGATVGAILVNNPAIVLQIPSP